MNRSELESIARAMVAKGKGILAADESSGTIKKRFDGIKLESTEEARRTYREMLFTAPGAADYISGVILYDETIRQKTKDGTPFPQYLSKLGIVPGIKVDTGAKPLAGFPERDDHRRSRRPARAARRVPQARRALRQVARGHRHRRRHSDAVRDRRQRACAGALRRAVPGSEHRADRRAGSADGRRSLASSAARKSRAPRSRPCSQQLHSHRIHLEGMILKPNMVISGKKAAHRAPIRSRWPKRPCAR